jgi:TetR/AcrR family transcriptional repressor of nem operon
MGHSQAGKKATHDRIVKIASARFRELGLEGIGVADVMKQAGVTVGGFYKHFKDRDQLVVEALADAFPDGSVIGGSGQELAEDIRSYLSVRHRDDPGKGCAMGALLGGMPHASKAVRRKYTDQFKKNLDLVSEVQNAESPSDKRARALLMMCALYGAINLARGVDNAKLSKEILETVSEELIRRLCPER